MRASFRAEPNPFSEPLFPQWRVHRGPGPGADGRPFDLRLDIEHGVCTFAPARLERRSAGVDRRSGGRGRLTFHFELVGTAMRLDRDQGFGVPAFSLETRPFVSNASGDWIVARVLLPGRAWFLLGMSDRLGRVEIVVPRPEMADRVRSALAPLFATEPARTADGVRIRRDGAVAGRTATV